ncbi:hypothetical protein OG216_39425 [Streptomycetaceae bacterium NBC_01309]
MRISADVDERTPREIYLPAFERVVAEARPATVDSMPMRQFVGFIGHLVTTEHLDALIGRSHER